MKREKKEGEEYFYVKSISALFTTERFFFRKFNKRCVVVGGNKIDCKKIKVQPYF